MKPHQDSGIVPSAVEKATRDGESSLTPMVNPAQAATPVDAVAPTPDLQRTAEAIGTSRTRSIEATVLTTLALLYTLYFAREFLIPIVFALLLNFLLSPVIRRLARWHVKPPLGASLVVVLLIAAVSGAAYQLT